MHRVGHRRRMGSGGLSRSSKRNLRPRDCTAYLPWAEIGPGLPHTRLGSHAPMRRLSFETEEYTEDM